MKLERKKMVELSQLLIENKILEIKKDPLAFWDVASSLDPTIIESKQAGEINTNFNGYQYDVSYKECGVNQCTINFKIKTYIFS